MTEPFSIPGIFTDPTVWQSLKWEPFREGVDVSWIYQSDIPTGPAAAFLRYEAGATVPEHEHTGYEHILVLVGAQSDKNGNYLTGSLAINTPGARHTVQSEHGCIVLAIWEKPVRFTEA